MIEDVTEDDFKPKGLVGKRIFFQCQDQSVPPIVLEIGEIISHHKAYKRSWTYIGRGDLVTFKLLNTDTVSKDWSFGYQEITALLNNGIITDRRGLKYEILK